MGKKTLGWAVVATVTIACDPRTIPKSLAMLGQAADRRRQALGVRRRACMITAQAAQASSSPEISKGSGRILSIVGGSVLQVLQEFCAEFRDTLAAGGVSCVALPARSPNLNCYAERWVRSVKAECLSQLILFGESSLRRALKNFCEYYHAERNYQGKDNTLLFPRAGALGSPGRGMVRCQQRLGGLLKYYYREAA
jgi:hypothetical protein